MLATVGHPGPRAQLPARHNRLHALVEIPRGEDRKQLATYMNLASESRHTLILFCQGSKPNDTAPRPG